jgi:hypothetical protein
LGSLHRSDCPLLDADIAEARQENEYVDGRPFLSWQKGAVYGFWPCSKCIPHTGHSDDFTAKLFMALSTSALIATEALLAGFFTHFLFLLIGQVLFYAVRREVMWPFSKSRAD